MKYAFIAVEKAFFPVNVLCDVLDVSRSGFYAFSKRPEPPRKTSDAQLAVEIVAIHRRSRRTYGSPRVHAELRARGVAVSTNLSERLLRGAGRAARRNRRLVDPLAHIASFVVSSLGQDAKLAEKDWIPVSYPHLTLPTSALE